MKILVAVDGSSFSKRMLAYIAAHDEWLGGQHEYTLIHVVTPLPHRLAVEIDRATLKAYHADEAERVFKPIRAFFARQKLKATFVAKVGAPADEIATVAARGDYTLLMLGSHGHGVLANIVLGSVAAKVLAACKTPVLLIR